MEDNKEVKPDFEKIAYSSFGDGRSAKSAMELLERMWEEEVKPIQSQLQRTQDELRRAKEAINKAEIMYKAFQKTLNQLASDGVAIDGFTDSWSAVNEYHKSMLEIEIESFLKDK